MVFAFSAALGAEITIDNKKNLRIPCIPHGPEETRGSMRKLVYLVSALAILGMTAPAHALFTNGGFEDGRFRPDGPWNTVSTGD